MRTLLVIAALCIPLSAADWALARSPHFDVYAQEGEGSAESLARWLEQLRTFFRQQTRLQLPDRPPLRVIAFRSEAEYEPYRLSPAATAYFAATEGRDYIVLAGSTNFQIAVHEYWHFIGHTRALNLPPWLNEGLAEYFSSVRLGVSGGITTREIEAKYRILKAGAWLPLRDLLAMPAESPLRETREGSGKFYAESWAVTAMLKDSPGYGPRFSQLLGPLGPGADSAQALLRVYSKPLDAIAADLHAWVAKRKFKPLIAPDVPSADAGPKTSTVTPQEVRLVLAELSLDIGKLDRAEGLYEELAREAPDNADVSAGLAAVAVRKGQQEKGRRFWKMALEHGVTDAAACYRFAVMGLNAGFPPDDVRTALERAIALQPLFDDALYNLALLENNAGMYAAALQHLNAMNYVSSGRQFAYWTAKAYAANELDQREEAKAAAEKATDYAANGAERAYADELRTFAMTDPVVQMTHDASGHVRLINTRAPRDASEWNPFIEPGDQVRRVEARLHEIECGGPLTIFALKTAAGILRLTVADPLHVQMRNAPPEFTCGDQADTPVVAVFAASGPDGGLLRGMEFSSPPRVNP